MRRRVVVFGILVASAAVLLGAIALLWLAQAAGTPRVTAAAVPSAPPVRSVPRPPLPALPAPDTRPPADQPESPWLAGHEAVAQALGYVTIVCWVGPEWDTDDLVGRYYQQIENGWYTHVEMSLSGRHGVERRYEVPGVPEDASWADRLEFETLFEVSWSASRPGETVPCQVHTLDRAELRVRLVSDDGEPIAGATVSGCGSSTTADASGLAVLEEVHAATACEVMGLHTATEQTRLCQGKRDVAPLAKDEVREIDLPLDCLDLMDPAQVERVTEMWVPPDEAPDEDDLPEIPIAEELARLRLLDARDLGEATNDLVDDLIAKDEDVLAHEARWAAFERRRLAIDELFERAASAPTAEEREEMHAEAWRRQYELMREIDAWLEL